MLGTPGGITQKGVKPQPGSSIKASTLNFICKHHKLDIPVPLIADVIHHQLK